MCLLTVLYFFGIRFSSLRTVLLWCEKNGTNTVLVRNLALPRPRSTVADVRSVDCTTPARSQHGVALSLSLSLRHFSKPAGGGTALRNDSEVV